MSSVCQESNTGHNSASFCVCVCVDEELQNEDELDKELLWNLQLLSEVREHSIKPQRLQCSKTCNLPVFELCLKVKSILKVTENREHISFSLAPFSCYCSSCLLIFARM